MSRKDLVPSAIDDVADPAFDPDETFTVDAGEVPGADVAIRIKSIVQALPVRVSRGHTWRPHQQLPDGVD